MPLWWRGNRIPSATNKLVLYRKLLWTTEGEMVRSGVSMLTWPIRRFCVGTMKVDNTPNPPKLTALTHQPLLGFCGWADSSAVGGHKKRKGERTMSIQVNFPLPVSPPCEPAGDCDLGRGVQREILCSSVASSSAK